MEKIRQEVLENCYDSARMLAFSISQDRGVDIQLLDITVRRTCHARAVPHQRTL